MKRNPYESLQYLNEYLLFHYGKPRDICPFPFVPQNALNFHRRIINDCLRPFRSSPPTHGLDVGCAVGRLTFELARVVDHALGIDNSRNFICMARQIAMQQKINIRCKEEGEIHSVRQIELPGQLRKGRVEFQVEDAQNLAGLKKKRFHVVLAVNLIDRLPDPRQFLKQVGDIIVPGGQLLIGSPYTWLAEYTSSKKWVGGHISGGKAIYSSEQIQSILKSKFRFVSCHDLPFLIREHRRKYQWNVSEISVFLKKK